MVFMQNVPFLLRENENYENWQSFFQVFPPETNSTLLLVSFDDHFKRQVFFTSMAALIPLSEFSDPGVMKKYGVKPDPETLDILSTAASQKDVISFLLELNLQEYRTLI